MEKENYTQKSYIFLKPYFTVRKTMYHGRSKRRQDNLFRHTKIPRKKDTDESPLILRRNQSFFINSWNPS
jgi:hypothetical protein